MDQKTKIESTITEEEHEAIFAATDGLAGTRDGLFFALGAMSVASYLSNGSDAERRDAGEYLRLCLSGASDALSLAGSLRRGELDGGVKAVVFHVC